MANIRLHGCDLVMSIEINSDKQTKIEVDNDIDSDTDSDITAGVDYAVDEKYLWLSCFSMYTRKTSDQLDEKYDQKDNYLFRMDYEKKMKEYIAENPMDFLVLDMYYTFNTPIAIYKGDVYSYNKGLKSSKFYIENQDDFEILHFEDIPKQQWQSYIDRYVELISQYYDKDHIILIRMNFTNLYLPIRGNKPKVWEREDFDIKAKNAGIRELEDYFIEKTNCYSIDIAKYFYIQEKAKKPLRNWRYENECFVRMRELVYEIIDNQPAKKVFEEKPYDRVLFHYIDHFEEGNVPGEYGCRLDENDLVDGLVLTLNKATIERYWNDLYKIKKMHPKSIDDILDNYDFWCAVDLKELLRSIQAVKNKDYDNAKVHYDLLYQYEDSLRTEYTKVLKNEWAKYDALAAKNITDEDACLYYDVISLIRQKKQKEAVKRLKRLNKEHPNFVLEHMRTVCSNIKHQ